MLVQVHGEETRSATSSEQSARDGRSVSQQETSAPAVFAAPITSLRCLTMIENYRRERIWRVLRCDRSAPGLGALGVLGFLFALNARLTTKTVRITTTSNAAVETAAAIRASA
jgi:hypothetical protein